MRCEYLSALSVRRTHKTQVSGYLAVSQALKEKLWNRSCYLVVFSAEDQISKQDLSAEDVERMKAMQHSTEMSLKALNDDIQFRQDAIWKSEMKLQPDINEVCPHKGRHTIIS